MTYNKSCGRAKPSIQEPEEDETIICPFDKLKRRRFKITRKERKTCFQWRQKIQNKDWVTAAKRTIDRQLVSKTNRIIFPIQYMEIIRATIPYEASTLSFSIHMHGRSHPRRAQRHRRSRRCGKKSPGSIDCLMEMMNTNDEESTPLASVLFFVSLSPDDGYGFWVAGARFYYQEFTTRFHIL